MYANPIALLLLIPSCLFLGLAVYIARFVNHRPALLFMLCVLSLVIVTTSSMFEQMSAGLDTMLWWVRLKYSGIALFPMFWLMLIFRKHLKIPAAIGTAIIPLVTAGLVWTTPLHNLFFLSMDMSTSENISAFAFSPGIWHSIFSIYALAVFAFGIIWCFIYRKAMPVSDRKGFLFLHLATLFVFLPEALRMSGMQLIHNVDMGPYFLTITALIMIFALVRYEIFQISPVARMRLIESLKDPFIVLDMHNIVVDFNPGFEALYHENLPKAPLAGCDASLLYDTLGLSTELCRESWDEPVDWEHMGRHYEIQTFPVTKGRRMHGLIHYFHDYTERKLYEQQLRASLLRLEKLNDLSRVLSMWLGKGDMTRVTIETATELLGAVFGALFFLESGGLHERARSGIAKSGETDSPIDVLLQEAAFEAITSAGTILVRRPPYNVIAVPLNAEILHGQPGALVFVKSEDTEFSSFDTSLAESVARQLAVTVETARLYREVERRAQVDGLTSVFTRRHFESLARHEFSYSQRHKLAFCIIMADIDFFKNVNDTHGHPAGDAVLRQVAERLRVNVREADILGRYGGEEFVILLPATPEKTAMVVAERVHNAIRSKTMDIGTGEIEVTASFGLSEYTPGIDANLDAVVKRADQALYDAKHSGRNCVKFKKHSG